MKPDESTNLILNDILSCLKEKQEANQQETVQAGTDRRRESFAQVCAMYAAIVRHTSSDTEPFITPNQFHFSLCL